MLDTEPLFLRSITPPSSSNAPPSDISKVAAVISELLSVPLNIMSVSFAVASMVMFPDEVDKVTAASPALISSAATPEPI